MSCKTETKDINNKQYSVTQWSASKSLLMKMKLLKALGPVLGLLAEGNNEEGEIDYSKILSGLFESTTPESVIDLISECIILNVACEGTKITASKFEELFSGDDLLDVYKVFAFVLGVNYGGFFKGQLASDLLAKVQDTL